MTRMKRIYADVCKEYTKPYIFICENLPDLRNLRSDYTDR